jgi:hypothetical protein
VPEQIIWLTNFFNKLIGHAASLGVDPAVCAAAGISERSLVDYRATITPMTVDHLGALQEAYPDLDIAATVRRLYRTRVDKGRVKRETSPTPS